MIYYNDEALADEVLARQNINKTQLTEWFAFNAKDQQGVAKDVLYQDFPKKFSFDTKTKTWKLRTRSAPAIGRMYFASPTQGERFYLRLLLTAVPGATSFKFLRTFNGQELDSFKSACLQCGLLENDNEWRQCLQEAGEMQTGSALRTLFAIILTSCFPSKPDELWNRFKHQICDDLRHVLETVLHFQNHNFTDDDVYDYGLYLLNDILIKSGKFLKNFPPMPVHQQHWEDQISDNELLNEQLDYNHAALHALVEQNYQSFNNEQRLAYDAAIESVQNNLGKMLFIHSGGGGGKTFLCNTIAAKVRSEGDVALCVASSGIAALLLEGGRTAHSRFKIPIPVHETSIGSISASSPMFEVLQRTKVIIWDEVPMQHKFAIDSVDRSLRDLLHKPDAPFGGITVVFGGDFRQTLPVVAKAGREQIIGASFVKGNLWRHVNVFYLKQNMRLDRTPDSDQHAAWLLDVGAGNNPDNENVVEIPEAMCCSDRTLESLIASTYPDIAQMDNIDGQYFLDRTILSAKNNDVHKINLAILDQIYPDREKQVMLSADSVNLDDSAVQDQPYPIEFLNSLNASGLPLSKLALKSGCPLMLLCNLDASKGLCNGSRLILTDIRQHVLKCKIITGDARFAGQIVLIPRITIEPSAETLAIPLQRRQFPVHVAFAMTINKSQGQGVKNVGLDLRTPVFSHGQLYVALSRCTSSNRIKVLLPEDLEGRKTPNIVYKEVFAGLTM